MKKVLTRGENRLVKTKKALTKSESLLINLLFLTSILIFIKIGPVSISFPIGVVALFYFSRQVRFRLFKNSIIWLTLLFAVGFLSALLSEIPFESNLYFIIQFVYWLLLASMVGELYNYIDKKSMAKFLAGGSVVLGAVYLLFGSATQNSVAFCLVVISPLGLYGLGKKRSKILYSLLLLVYMFFNESRTGFAILAIEMIFVYSQLFHIKNLRLITIVGIVIVALFFLTPLHSVVGTAIMPYNEDVGNLISDPESVFYYDKSWIQRKVQVQKGLQIFKEHPAIGVGPSNFSKLDVDINVSGIQNVDDTTLDTVMKGSSNRSTHNSYVTLLSEFGIIGLLAFVFFIIAYLRIVFRNSKSLDDFEYMLFVCVIGMLVYFYTIAALYGTAVWLFYGLIYGYTNMYRRVKYRSIKK
jgi:O-antigen ligase